MVQNFRNRIYDVNSISILGLDYVWDLYIRGHLEASQNTLIVSGGGVLSKSDG